MHVSRSKSSGASPKAERYFFTSETYSVVTLLDHKKCHKRVQQLSVNGADDITQINVPSVVRATLIIYELLQLLLFLNDCQWSSSNHAPEHLRARASMARTAMSSQWSPRSVVLLVSRNVLA